MNRRFRRVLNVSSLIFLCSLIIFYGYRLIYYYKLEHSNNSNEAIKFYQKLINNKGIEGMDYGLQSEDDEYQFGPKSTDNYLYYAGRLWRIIGIDNKQNIKIITDESQTILTWEDDTEFKDSNINIWLNNDDNEFSGIFEKSLKNQIDNVIENGNQKITLLTKKEFNSIGKDNYLINGTNFWIINNDNDNSRAYVNAKGEIIDDCEDNDTFNIRPVIVISKDFDYISGNGTLDNPYIIYNHNIETLSDSFVGEYLNFDDKMWRIIETNSDNVKVALEGYIETDEDIIFSKYDNIFMENDGIGGYLHNYYLNLKYKDYVLNNDYYIGTFSKNDNYSYLNTYDEKSSAYIGLFKIGDFFINNYDTFYTLTPSESSYDIIYTINKNKRLYADFINSEYKIRPVLYLDSKIFIISGNGTLDNPYEIGR